MAAGGMSKLCSERKKWISFNSGITMSILGSAHSAFEHFVINILFQGEILSIHASFISFELNFQSSLDNFHCVNRDFCDVLRFLPIILEPKRVLPMS